jgi:hypothetical protein
MEKYTSMPADDAKIIDNPSAQKFLVLWFNRNGHLNKGGKIEEGGVP